MEPRKVSETTVMPQSATFLCGNCSEVASERCTRCSAIKYCGKTCQKANWSSHKDYCNKIKQCRKKVEREAAKLRQYEDWSGCVVNLFEESVGHFWGLVDPRPYCRARHALDLALHKCGMANNSKLALELSIEHMLDLVWLNRGDNIGLRVLIPSIYCMLGKMQEAYDFLKWWQICDPDGRYDWGDTDLPYCNLQNENMFEDLSELKLHKYTNVHWLVSLFLIKYKLLVGLDKESGNSLDTTARIGILKGQLVELCKSIDAVNKFVLPGFLNSATLFKHNAPMYISQGSQNEAYSVVECELSHWQATPKILEYIKELYVNLHGAKQAETNVRELPKEKIFVIGS